MNDGVLALVIVMSLAVFFAVIFGALLFIIRRRKQRDGNTSSLVRDRIQRSMQGHQGTPVEADDAGFEEPSDGRSPAAAINDEQDLEEGGAHGLKDVNEFGQASSTKSRGTTYHDAHDNDSWLSSTTSSGTKSYLGGWFGLDSPTAGQEERGTRDERLKEIQDSMRRKDQRMRVADDDSDTDTIRGDNAENELGETREEEEARLAA